MKRYLQACETGGSIYGKKIGSLGKSQNEDEEKEDLKGAYDKLYKRQVNALNKVFKRVK